MALYDLLIRNGMLVAAKGVTIADIAIADERIVAIGSALDGTSQSEIDATGLHMFPGLIDAHVHFNEPGRADWEGFASGTRALAAGGSTAFFDMPLNAHPPTLDAASFDQKLAAAQASALVDFGLWGGLTPQNLDRLDELAVRGVIGFKAFMSNSGIDDFQSADDQTLYDGMACAARHGRIVAVHAENDQITGLLARRAVAERRISARDYLDSRPVVAELEAISRAILFASETGCKLHIVHVSSGRGVSRVSEARARGVDVSCETCPHYLVLSEDDLATLGAIAKCAPPLRPQREQDQLWQHLLSGTLPMVASDHSPAPPAMKQIENVELKIENNAEPALNSQFSTLNFFDVWGGISGCQSTLHLLLTEGYFQRQLPLETIATVTAEFVAQRFGLPQKGRLAVGADADLALVDLAHSATLQPSDLHYRHQHSPYIGRTLHGRIVRTILRGTTVCLDGKIVATPSGRLLTPK